MTRPTAADAIDAVWRIESARLIAGLARLVGDIGVAEDLAQDALVAALEQWHESGVPDNPGAWLMATAKHRAIDHLRRGKMQDRKHEHLGRELEERQISPEHDLAAAIDDQVGDDLLSLIFTACHPVLTTEARVALTLRLLGGLTTEEIARAFLVPRRRFNSGSFAPSAPSPPRACRSKSRAAPSWDSGSSRCSKSSISFSTRGTRRPRATSGSGRRCAKTRFASAVFSPSWRPPRRRSTDSSR